MFLSFSYLKNNHNIFCTKLYEHKLNKKIIEINFYNFVMKVCIHEKVVDRVNLYNVDIKVCIGMASCEKVMIFYIREPIG